MDRKGPFLVETTAWEARKNEQHNATGEDGGTKARPFQWAGNWHDADMAQ